MKITWDFRTTDVLLALITAGAIPWFTWSTKTLFEVKQDIALIRSDIKNMSEKTYSKEPLLHGISVSGFFCNLPNRSQKLLLEN